MYTTIAIWEVTLVAIMSRVMNAGDNRNYPGKGRFVFGSVASAPAE